MKDFEEIYGKYYSRIYHYLLGLCGKSESWARVTYHCAKIKIKELE